MSPPCIIRLLASTNNAIGDLFTRLCKDLFFALGYDDLRLDIHKTGRELDLQGKHRYEPRCVIAECKAHSSRMGGAELNKFFGVLCRERIKCAPVPLAGYFVSLSGFTETGIEQEIETGNDRVILFDAQQVIQELERSRLLIGYSEAAERAGHCAQHGGVEHAVLDGGELLGHERGYLWAVFYARGKERTHFALIHADGTPLAGSLASEVINVDSKCGGYLRTLTYLSPPPPAPDRDALVEASLLRYRRWLGEECGYIQLDGLPADTELSATRLRLERLYVPLRAFFLPQSDDALIFNRKNQRSYPFGKILRKTRRLALVGAPGSGKSTLIKRLVTVYAFPERRTGVSDGLPKDEWLPLFLRCRELRERAHRPILEILDDLCSYSGMNVGEATAFSDAMHEALRSGRALLMIDGLDEISDEGARRAFTYHLRTFLAVFPLSNVIITSREAGFRVVAGVLVGMCIPAKLAPLRKRDMRRLCIRWHVEIVGRSDKVRIEAHELVETIWKNERIRVLAENPLLLTTLLVVKRWIGELPRSRVALYREAMRVLIRTWNVEGYAPMDEEETLAQLSYVACSMMEQGLQQIDHGALLNLLRNARRELEAELQFARISPTEFVERIEYRSSLLMQVGHNQIDGELQPVYEFRHLTFQEYLAARGYVTEQYPGRSEGRSLADLLTPHFQDKRWSEVIPLAAVLAGRKAEEIIKRLTSECEDIEIGFQWVRPDRLEPFKSLLGMCLIDEVQATTEILRSALQQMARGTAGLEGEIWAMSIRGGKFGALFEQVCEEAYLSGGSDFEEYMGVMAELAVYAYFGLQKPAVSQQVMALLAQSLASGNRLEMIRAAMACMALAFSCTEVRFGEHTVEHSALAHQFQPLYDRLSTLIESPDPPLTLAVTWALSWIGSKRLTIIPPEPGLVMNLYRLWRGNKWHWIRYFAAWTFSAQPLLSRDAFPTDVWGECEEFLLNFLGDKPHPPGIPMAPYVVAWYRRAPWTDNELATLIGQNIRRGGEITKHTAREILESLGEAGRRELERFNRNLKEIAKN